MDLDLALFLPRPPFDFERLRLENNPPFFLPEFASTSGKLQARHRHINNKYTKELSLQKL